MIAVIFEALPNEGKHNDYFDLASQLKPELLKIEGFISIERFQSINNLASCCLCPFGRMKKVLNNGVRWNCIGMHKQQGRQFIFKDYRLRVANVMRDYGMTDRKQAPTDSNLIHKH